jgi:hypothetical protein
MCLCSWDVEVGFTNKGSDIVKIGTGDGLVEALTLRGYKNLSDIVEVLLKEWIELKIAVGDVSNTRLEELSY